MKIYARLLRDLIRQRDAYFSVPPLYIHNNDTLLVNDSMIHTDLKIPPNIPGCGVIRCKDMGVGYFDKIVVNKKFSTLPYWVQDALLTHEEGHTTSDKYYGNALGSPSYYEEELIADLYAHAKGKNILSALVYLQSNYPVLVDVKRLENLKTALKATQEVIPLELIKIDKFVKLVEKLKAYASS